MLRTTKRASRRSSRRLRALRPALVVLEATGGRELPVAAALATAGLAVAVVNPRQVRDFARAIGQLAKTDALDAQVLARFAEVVHPTPRPLPDAQAQELSALLARRRQLIGMRTAERQRLDTATPAVRPHIQAHIAWLEEELADLDRQPARRGAGQPAVARTGRPAAQRAGHRAGHRADLLAEVPELGRLDRKAIAALVGVAPLNCESGTCAAGAWSGAAGPGYGRPCTWPRWSRPATTRPSAPSTNVCVRRKPKKVALTACMHKLLLIATLSCAIAPPGPAT